MIDSQKIDKIEDFPSISANTKVLGYDPASNKIGTMKVAAIQNKIPYCGCRWKKGNSSTEGEPVGDLQMLVQLPSILGLGGYLVQNNHSRRKLSASTHFQFDSGGTAKLDGSMGHYQWGWNVPFYYAHWEDDIYEYEAVSTAPMSGRWNYRIPVASIACSGASALDRTNNILVSYCNRTAQYRGGTNDATLDSKWNTMLGKPVVNVAENVLQQAAETNGARWGASMDPLIFMVGVLTRIIFHNRSIQTAYNATLTADGLHRGGLGMGIADVSNDFGKQYATVDIDALADKGDALGVFEVDKTKDNGTTEKITGIPCFFGLKNFYKYIWCMRHGSLLYYNADKTITVYGIEKWTKDTVPTDVTTGMKQRGVIPVTTEGWIKRMNLDNMCQFPLELGGSETTYYGDYLWRPNNLTSGLRGLLALGAANSGGNAGVGCFDGGIGPGLAWTGRGAALCEAVEDWDLEPFWQA